MQIVKEIAIAFMLFLPAGISNIAPIPASRFDICRKLNIPIDFNKKFRGKRLFGEHKTIRGFLVGVLLSSTLSTLVYTLLDFHIPLRGSLVSSRIGTHTTALDLLYAGAVGYGALFGDAVESFFKRQIGIKPGGRWIPFDQLDYVLGALVFITIMTNISWINFAIILILGTTVHPVFTYLGWRLKMKNDPI